MTTREAVLAATDAFYARAEPLFAKSLRRVLKVLAARLGGRVVAAGEEVSVHDLAVIVTLWANEVDDNLLPFLDEMFGAGALATGTQLRMALDAQIAALGIDPVQGFVSRRSIEHLANARNRLMGFGDAAWAVMRDQLLEGFRAGEGIDKLSRRLTGAFDLLESRARTIARTEVLTAANAGALAEARALGDFAPNTKAWLSTEDGRVDEECQALEDVGPIGLDEEFPGGYDAPPAHANCRCTLIWGDVAVGAEPATPVTVVAEDELAASAAQEAEMTVKFKPWDIVGNSVDCPPESPWAVVDVETGNVEGCFADEAAAQTKVDELVAADPQPVDEPTNTAGSGPFIHAWGVLDVAGEHGAEAARLIGDGFLQGVSIDVDDVSDADVELVWPTDPANPDSLMMEPDKVIYHHGRIMGFTATPNPAFQEAYIEMVPGGEPGAFHSVMVVEGVETGDGREFAVDSLTWRDLPLGAVKWQREEQPMHDGAVLIGRIDMIERRTNADSEAGPAPMAAAAATITIPDVPPAWWFDEPIDVPIEGALTITDEGRVFGYLAPRGVRHLNPKYRGRTVPMGNVDYSGFMRSETFVANDDGSIGRIAAGTVTMGCGHNAASRHSIDHLENTCSLAAKVRVGENARGVWVAGAVLPDVTPAQIERMMLSQLSGEWWPNDHGRQELRTALLVPVPGFPLARKASTRIRRDNGEDRLVASAVPVQYRHHDDIGEAPVDLLPIADRIARGLGLDRLSRAAAVAARVNGA